MRGKQREPARSVFGRWIDAQLDRRGWTIARLAEVAGVSSPRITQLRQGDSTTREMVQRLSQALIAMDADEDAARRYTNEAFRAAGFLSDEETCSPDELRVHGILYEAGWSEVPEPVQQVILRMIKHERDVARKAKEEGRAPSPPLPPENS